MTTYFGNAIFNFSSLLSVHCRISHLALGNLKMGEEEKTLLQRDTMQQHSTDFTLDTGLLPFDRFTRVFAFIQSSSADYSATKYRTCKLDIVLFDTQNTLLTRLLKEPNTKSKHSSFYFSSSSLFSHLTASISRASWKSLSLLSSYCCSLKRRFSRITSF